jgi:hypothetical protein
MALTVTVPLEVSRLITALSVELTVVVVVRAEAPAGTIINARVASKLLLISFPWNDFATIKLLFCICIYYLS